MFPALLKTSEHLNRRAYCFLRLRNSVLHFYVNINALIRAL